MFQKFKDKNNPTTLKTLFWRKIINKKGYFFI